MDKRDKRAYLLNNNKINKEVFINRRDAIERVRDTEIDKEEILETNISYDEKYNEGDNYYDWTEAI